MATSPDTDETRSWRERLLPTGVIGITVLILATSLGAAFSGTVLYAYYEYRLNRSEERVAKFVKGFDQRFDAATKTIEAERENAKAEINKTLEPLKRIRAEGETLDALSKKLEPSLWFVRTTDEGGQPSVGSAFVVASDADQSLLVTSFNTVRAASHQPGPQIFVRKGDSELKATLWTWQEERDVALLIITKGSTPKLSFAPRDPPLRIGERVFAASGLAAGGAAVTQGLVADVSSAAIQHDAAVGPAFQGGPLVNSNGELLGVASRAYAPLGFSSDSLFFGVPIRAVCEKILKCPGDAVSGPGTKR
jgi:S1-C subfamily serine protease